MLVMSKKCFLVFAYSMVGLLASCNNNNVRFDDKEINPEAIYFDYKIWGDEERNHLTVRLQYRLGDSEGPTWLIPDPGKVELDGELMEPDSSKRNGVWYELSKPLDEFEGKHVIVFTNYNDKEYKEEFDFKAISLKREIPAVINRDDLVFELDGLNPEDQIRVLLTDTAFYSRGIDRVDTLRNGRIHVSLQDLENLKNGPVAIEFYKEMEKHLKETTSEGGRLSISYGLKRVFELRDAPNR